MEELFLLPMPMEKTLMHEPIMYVFADNNGSGKNTIRNLIIERLGISINIDPDSLARGIDSNIQIDKEYQPGKKQSD